MTKQKKDELAPLQLIETTPGSFSLMLTRIIHKS